MSKHIERSIHQPLRIILKQPEPEIAVVAEQSTKQAGAVIVIDCKIFASSS